VQACDSHCRENLKSYINTVNLIHKKRVLLGEYKIPRKTISELNNALLELVGPAYLQGNDDFLKDRILCWLEYS
jgi:hypothetical protein